MINNFIIKDGCSYIKLDGSCDEIKLSHMALTEEQCEILNFSLYGNDFKVNAFAGTGKTTLIKAIASALDRMKFDQKTIYLAFNKDIAADVGSDKPDSMKVYTFHQLARTCIIDYDPRLVKKLKNPFVNYYIDLRAFFKNNESPFKDDILLKVCLDVISEFMKSPSDTFHIDHIKDSYTKRIYNKIFYDFKEHNEILESEPNKTIDNFIKNSKLHSILIDKILNLSSILWNIITDPNNDIQLSFDAYLKYWSLISHTFKVKTVLIDEAQDIDPVMLAAVGKIKAQKIYVGDKNQQIYRWRGAVNAMESIECDEFYITESFRFDKTIAHMANKILQKLGNYKKIITNKSSSNKYEDNMSYTILCRTNLAIIKSAFDLAKNKKVCVVSSNKGSYLDDVIKICELLSNFEKGIKSNHPLFREYESFNDLIQNQDDLSNDIYQALKVLEHFEMNLNIIKSLKSQIESNIVKSESEAEIIISSAHLSKGREWDYIKIEDDFAYHLNKYKGSSSFGDLFCDELRLFYVAITRSKKSILNESYVHRLISEIIN